MTEKLWSDLREAADSLEFDENPVVSFPDDPRDLDAVLARLSLVSRAVRWLQEQARLQLAEATGPRGYARFGPRVYRTAPDRKVKVKREVEGELWEFIGPHARQLFNPHSARTGQLRSIADGYVDPDTGEIGYDAFEARFYDVELGETKVTELPADKAPQFIQKSEEGVYWRD